MNEQIKELADKAGLGMLTNPDDTWAKYLEKFAELIIQECANVAKLTEADYGNDYKSGRTWAGIDILKHFGVEE